MDRFRPVKEAGGPGLSEAAAAGLRHPSALEDGDRPADGPLRRSPAGEDAAANALRDVRPLRGDPGRQHRGVGPGRPPLPSEVEGRTAEGPPPRRGPRRLRAGGGVLGCRHGPTAAPPAQGPHSRTWERPSAERLGSLQRRRCSNRRAQQRRLQNKGRCPCLPGSTLGLDTAQRCRLCRHERRVRSIRHQPCPDLSRRSAAPRSQSSSWVVGGSLRQLEAAANRVVEVQVPEPVPERRTPG